MMLNSDCDKGVILPHEKSAAPARVTLMREAVLSGSVVFSEPSKNVLFVNP